MSASPDLEEMTQGLSDVMERGSAWAVAAGDMSEAQGFTPRQALIGLYILEASLKRSMPADVRASLEGSGRRILMATIDRMLDKVEAHEGRDVWLHRAPEGGTMKPKTYLGDGAYARITEYGDLELTTEDGISVQNRVVLGPTEWAYLKEYVEPMENVAVEEDTDG